VSYNEINVVTREAGPVTSRTQVYTIVEALIMQEADISSALLRLNDKILHAENDGSSGAAQAFFDSMLAPHFAFRRGNGEVVGRSEFLEQLQSGGDRVCVESYVVTPLGQSCALVTCTIRLTMENRPREFDNVRLFVRGANDAWLLLAWANEPSEHHRLPEFGQVSLQYYGGASRVRLRSYTRKRCC
jgi:hypothetical protein